MIEKHLDKVWSKAIKERDSYHCLFGLPGCFGKGTDACHIFSRSYQKLRWNINNGLTGCRKCHDWCGRHTKLFEALVRRIVDEKIWKELTDILEREYGIKK